jgi:hypothetical protein
MAIRLVNITGGNGFPITHEVDGVADHAALPNSVYFKQKDLSDLVRYKDSLGNILDAFSTAGAGSGDMEKSVYDTNNDGVVDFAEKLPVEVINKTGATLTKGTIVYLRTTSSSTNYPEALKANASSSATSDKTLGAVYADILDNATGYVIVAGQVHNLDTSMYNVGDRLWLSTTDGLVTTTQPIQPNHSVFIGHVTRSQVSNGRILYNIQNGYHLNDLHNVLLTTPVNNDFLYYDGVGGLWKNKAITGADITQSSTYRFVTDTEKSTWNAKEPAISSGTTLQYWRGDKTWQTLDKSAVGLGNVDNTADIDKIVSTATTTAINTATSNTSILSKILTGLNITGGAITSSNTILEAFGQVQNQINTLFGQAITTVANYSALPDPTTVNGKFYWCQASQGTKWLPGPLGGTFYNSGLYHSNGTTWEYMEYAYQATQAEVNAGLVTDKFVSPATLQASTQWGSSISGVAILNFGNEEDAAIVTVLNVDITPSNLRLVTFVPQETVETSLDDFKLNGVSFNIENIISNTSFDVRGTALNGASGNYTVNYYITIS